MKYKIAKKVIDIGAAVVYKSTRDFQLDRICIYQEVPLEIFYGDQMGGEKEAGGWQLLSTQLH